MFGQIYFGDIDVDFNKLQEGVDFEDITNGRKGAIIVEPVKDNDKEYIPVVRTTTIYKNKPVRFNQAHKDIISMIKKEKDLSFNNGMVEIYDSRYKTMKYHSDQALDLVDDSYIAIYSCYSNPKHYNRSLVIIEKESKDPEDTFEFPLHHNSVVLFSTDANKKHLHKIVLDKVKSKESKWLGITFRLSKTYSSSLRLANEEEKKEFYKYKGMENSMLDFVYPAIDYAISPSDLVTDL